MKSLIRSKRTTRQWFSSWGWIATVGVAIATLGLFILLSIQMAFQNNSSSGSVEITGGRLSEDTLSWQGAIRAELVRQGANPDEHIFWLLGILQQESGGKVTSTNNGDIFQSSEGMGLPHNTPTDPLVSIKNGVSLYLARSELASSLGITDIKAILATYNFGNAFLTRMNADGKTSWDIEYAESYSKNVVYPAVTGKPSNTAVKQPSPHPVTEAVGKPYYWKNGGDFHYPNRILYHISGATNGSVNFDGTFQPPHKGGYRVSSEFGMRIHPITGKMKLHGGIDLVGNDKTIYAIGDGTVVKSEYHRSWGNHVVIDHGVIDGKRISSLYAHFSQLGVPAGTVVKQGQAIGTEGTTGDSTGVHLHLEVLETEPMGNPTSGERINPRNIILFD